MVLYETQNNGVSHALGTSGFLYRSNKLMYDKKTSSLWSTLHGEPVLGPLVGEGIKLQRRSVVTSTWGAWKARHPSTKVLSLETGYDRDYDEGVAYQSYFATDRLMFKTPYRDERLPNKREVVALRTDDPKSAVAIDTEFLKRNPVYHLEVSGERVVVLTNSTGESRVYDSGQIEFGSWDGQNAATDRSGGQWRLDEQALSQADSATTLKRYPSHQSFWFGWQAQFPETRLIK